MLAFIHIPKNAGVTMNLILRSSFGLRHCDVQPWHARSPDPFVLRDLEYLYRFYPNLHSIAGHRVVPHVGLENGVPDIKYFTLLRDPLKRCASFFQYLNQKKGRGYVFEEWIQEARNGQTIQIAGKPDASLAKKMIRDKNIFVGLVERFDESIFMLKEFHISDLNLAYKRKNVARSNEIAEKLLTTERTRQMLIDSNQADLELYAYVKQDLYPSYCQEYGDTLTQDVAAYRENPGKVNYYNILVNRLYRNLAYKPALGAYRLWLSKRRQI